MDSAQGNSKSGNGIVQLYTELFTTMGLDSGLAHRRRGGSERVECGLRPRSTITARILDQIKEEIRKPDCPVRDIARKHNLRAADIHVLMAALHQQKSRKPSRAYPSGKDIMSLLFTPEMIPGLVNLLVDESPLLRSGLLIAQGAEGGALDRHYAVSEQFLKEIGGEDAVQPSEPKVKTAPVSETRMVGPMQLRDKPRFTLSDVVLTPDTRAKLEVVMAGNAASGTILNDWGLGECVKYGGGSAVLLYGPPGTGKTLLAEAIAGTIGVPFATVQLPLLVSKFVGDTEKNISRVLQYVAKESNKCVLLIDEADGLLSRRIADPQTASDGFRNQELLVFCQEIEKLEAGGSIVVLASNSAPTLDPALDRRLTSIEVPTPGVQERSEIWSRFLGKGVPLADDVDYERLSSFELTGGLIKNAVLAAASQAICRSNGSGEAPLVTMADLLSGVELSRASYRQGSQNERRIGFI